MKKKLLLIVVSLVLLVGLQACTTTSASKQKAFYPQKAIMDIGDADAAVTILVYKDGKISFKDEKGVNFGLCRLPGTKASNPDLPLCKVSGQKMAVKVMKAIPVIETEGSGCFTFGPDGFGQYWEYCW
jgi:hypothetical protein